MTPTRPKKEDTDKKNLFTPYALYIRAIFIFYTVSTVFFTKYFITYIFLNCIYLNWPDYNTVTYLILHINSVFCLMEMLFCADKYFEYSFLL